MTDPTPEFDLEAASAARYAEAVKQAAALRALRGQAVAKYLGWDSLTATVQAEWRESTRAWRDGELSVLDLRDGIGVPQVAPIKPIKGG